MAGEFNPYHVWLGIPPDELPANYYRLLGLRLFEDNRDVIDNAADRQSAHLRTFQSGKNGALTQKLLNEVAAARVCLLDPKKRADYDKQLRAKLPRATPTAATAKGIPVAPAVAAPAPAAAAVPEPATAWENLLGDVDLRSSEKRAAQSARQRANRSRNLIMGIAAAIVVVCAGVGFFVLNSSSTANNPPESSGTTTPGKSPPNSSSPATAPTDGVLVFNWPAADRAGASVSVDGKALQIPASAEWELHAPPGSHHITGQRPGQKLDEGISLAAGQRQMIAANWKTTTALVFDWPLAARADAQLEIDGNARKVTEEMPMQIPVAPGEHQIHVAYSSGQSVSLSVTVLPDTMNHVPLAMPATLLVFDWPADERADAVIVIDGHDRPRPAGAGAEQFRLAVTPGAHVVRIVRPGFVDFSQLVDLPVGSANHIKPVWTPIAPLAALMGAGDGRSAAASPIDLLKSADTAQNALKGKWTRNGTAVACQERGLSVLTLPTSIDGSYDLQIDFTRTAGGGEVGFIFPIGSHRAQLTFNTHNGEASGIDTLERRRPFDAENPIVRRPGKIELSHRYRLQIAVRRIGADDASIDVFLNGQRYLPHWAGPASSLGTTWKSSAGQAAVGAYDSAVTFHAVTLQQIDSQSAAGGIAGITAQPGNGDSLQPATGALPIDQAVDILSALNTDFDVIHGHWMRIGNGIISDGPDINLIELPPVIDGGYDLDVEFTRRRGDNDIVVEFPVGTHGCIAALSSVHGDRGGLFKIDGKLLRNGEFTARPSKIENGRRYALSVRVRIPQPDSATIDMLLDGEQYVPQWQGNPQALSVLSSWQLPNTHRIGLGAHEDLLAIHAVHLRMVSGQAWPDSHQPGQANSAPQSSSAAPESPAIEEQKQKWFPLEVVSAKSRIGARLTKDSGNIVFASGNLGPDTYTVTTKTNLRGITGFRMETLTDRRFPNFGPGRGRDGNFVLTGFSVTAAPAGSPARAQPIALQNAQADFNQTNFTAASALVGDPKSGWGIYPQVGRNHEAIFECASDLAGYDGGTLLTFTLRQELDRDKTDRTSIGKFRISVTTAPRPLKLDTPVVSGDADSTRSSGSSPANEQQLIRTTSVGGDGGTAFEDLGPPQSLLAGFEVSTGDIDGQRVVKSLKPVYMTHNGFISGEVHGKKPRKVAKIEPHANYAVGAIVVKGQTRIEGFKVVFMRIRGTKLNPRDFYESPWYGSDSSTSAATTLGGDGRPVAGIFGRSGSDLDNIGLLQMK